MNRSELQKLIDRTLAPAGFQRSGDDWYQRSNECVIMLNLQKSPYGGQFYVNLAASPLVLAGKPEPRENHCHIRCRLDAVADDTAAVSKAMDLEDPTSDTARADIITGALTEVALPILNAFETLDGIRSIVTVHPRAQYFLIHRDLKPLIAEANSA